MSTEPCFGFFGGQNLPSCGSCMAAKRCKAILMSDGFDILGDMVDHMLTELAGPSYRATTSTAELFQQLLKPPAPLTQAEIDLLAALGGQKPLGLPIQEPDIAV